MLQNIRLLMVLLILTPWLHGFVLLSGHEEARLEASPDQPAVYFALSDKVPKFSGRSDFADGRFADLDDQAFWRALVEEAMAQWNNVYGSYLELRLEEGVTSTKTDKEDRVHSIVVGSANLSAAAYAAPQVEDGFIVDCDIVVAKDKKPSAASLAHTIVHELGHCVGLGHNHTNYSSIMSYSRSGDSMMLGPDDKAGVIYLYPDPDVYDGKSRELLACGTVGTSTSVHALSFLLLLLPLLLAFVPSRR